MKITEAAVVCGCLLLTTGCSKPEAKFSTNSTTYVGGDTVRLKSESTGADAFEWSLNNQVIGNTPELVHVLDARAKGPLVFTLKASSGEKSSTATTTVMATTPLGTVSVWSTFAGVEVLQVNGEGEQPLGITASGFTTDPGCGSQGCITLALSPGTYTFDGMSTVTRSRRVVDVADNDCVSLKMH